MSSSPRSDQSGTTIVTRKRSTPALIATAIVAIIVVVHMFFTLTYNMPIKPVRAALPVAAAQAYMQPYFVQDYKIFAPDPVGSDHQLWVRAWVTDTKGEQTTSEWINATAVELAEPYRKVLRKQLSIVAAERQMSAYQALSPAQKEIVVGNFHRTGLDRLRDDLNAATPGTPGTVGAFIRSTEAADAYATQVAKALWSDEGTITAVQSRVVYDNVIRWNDRFDPNAKRPTAQIASTGWRPTLEFPGQDAQAFADTFTKWKNND